MVWEMLNDADLFLRQMSKAMVGLLLCGALCAVSFFFLGYCAHLTNTEALTPSWCPVAMFANGVKKVKGLKNETQKWQKLHDCVYFILLLLWLKYIIYYIIVLEFPAIIGSRIPFFSSLNHLYGFATFKINHFKDEYCFSLVWPWIGRLKNRGRGPQKSKRLEDIGELRMDSPIVLTFECEDALEDVNWF